MQDLGNAINESLSDSDRIAAAIGSDATERARLQEAPHFFEAAHS